jgi:pimeloyl-ACP methyl ester carboxylesterase
MEPCSMSDASFDPFDRLRMRAVPLVARPDFASDLRTRVHRRLGLAPPPGDIPMREAAGLEYEVGGKEAGDPVLLTHAGTATAYRPLMTEPALTGMYRLVRYHRRGFAGSARLVGEPSIDRDVADAVALLDALGIARAHIVGHSGSGVIALQLALDAPERVLSLVLEEPAIANIDERWGNGMRELVAPILERSRTDPSGAMEQWMRGISPTWRVELMGTVPGGPQQTIEDAETFFSDVRAVEEWRFETDRVAALSVPVLYLIAESGFPGTRAVMRRFRDLVPHTEVAEIADATHMLHTDQPEAVATALASFFTQHRTKES